MKYVIKAIMIFVVLAAVVCAGWYSYLVIKLVFTYQCKVYDGSGFDVEQKKICADYNAGGMYKVLTN